MEAPWVVRYADSYFLFYSGNGYTNGYAVGVAQAPAITGPYVKYSQNPILHNDTSINPIPFQCPGHCSVVQATDGTWAMVYHAWIGNSRAFRAGMLDTLEWEPTAALKGEAGAVVWPRMSNSKGVPSTTTQPIP